MWPCVFTELASFSVVTWQTRASGLWGAFGRGRGLGEVRELSRVLEAPWLHLFRLSERGP